MPSTQDIAAFRYGITEKLQIATGYLYLCNDQMNAFLRKKEGLPADSKATYNLLMCQKTIPPVPGMVTSDQRNIFFRDDLKDTIFYQEKTNSPAEVKNGHTAFEYDVYFFPDAMFITVVGDYISLENWQNGGNEPTAKHRKVSASLRNFINTNDGDPFVLSPAHTDTLIK